MSPAARKGFGVLVVEDERIISLAMSAMLRALGHRVLACVASGEEALAAASSLAPDLVLMDIRLEGEMDGIDAARAIRKGRDVPVAFTTAYTDPATRDRALATGPLAFLPKPVTPRDLVNLFAALAPLGA